MNQALKVLLIGFVFLLAGVLALIFHLAAGATVLQEYFYHEAPDELDFSFSYCRADTHTKESQLVWQEDIAVVSVTLSSNCGTSWIFGNYKVIDSGTLLLGYKSIIPSIVGCDCEYPATYRIVGLEKKDYDIETREYELINKTPWLLRSWMDIGSDVVEIKEF